MSQGLNKTKRRISSVKSTKKITKAMELIATVKLKKFKDTMVGNTSYSDYILHLIQSAYNNKKEEFNSIYVEKFNSSKSLYLIITSDLGLCAGYNSNIYKFCNEIISPDDDIFIIGNKGESHFRSIERSYTSINDLLINGISDNSIDNIAKLLIEKYLSRQYKSINIVYTHFKNSITFVPSVFKLFPIDIESNDNNYGFPPLFEPDVNEVIESLTPIYIKSLIYQKLLESQVSEQASRRTAMDNANDNADELLEKLTIEYNKARQAAITTEITDIVGAANAQK